MSKTQKTQKPLAGLKVVELGTLIAGPFCTRIMAEFGAEVIKVESPDGGDPLRKWRKLYEGTSLWWYVQARNKKSVTANLKHPAGREFVRKLIAEADILVENFRPGVLEKLGLGWDGLKADNPGLVMVRLSGVRADRAVQGSTRFWCSRRVDGWLALHLWLSRPPAGTHRDFDWRFDCRLVGCRGRLDGAAP
jgi:crotonobetainyl-CoA:carnitine CoA-transferase CaiB-like acyl-CoA transferase